MLTTARELANPKSKKTRKADQQETALTCRELLCLCDLIRSDMDHVSGFGEVFVGKCIYYYLLAQLKFDLIPLIPPIIDHFNIVALTARGFSKLFFEDFSDSLSEMGEGGQYSSSSKQILQVCSPSLYLVPPSLLSHHFL